MRIEIGFAFLMVLCNAVIVYAAALPDCLQSYVQLRARNSIRINSPNYPNGYKVPGGCQTKIAAPIFHRLNISCYFYVGVESSSCNIEDVLYLLVDGTTFVERGYKYCGSGRYISLQTSYNTAYIGFNATRISGLFSCNFTATDITRCECGARIKSRIIGGERMGLNTFPYMAAIIKTSTNRLNGGASIISSNTFYTAAHPFIVNNYLMAPNEAYITVGRDDLRKSVQYDTPYSANYLIDKIIIHPEYNHDTGINDIAIVIVKTIISFNRAVQPICLTGTNEAMDAYYNKPALLMGYGSFEFGSDFLNQLKVATSKVILNKECAALYNKTGNYIITQRDMCASSSSRNDTCQGDSGGPLVFEDFRDFLIGSVKDGPACGNGHPGIYQSSSYAVPWLRKIVPDINFFCTYKP